MVLYLIGILGAIFTGYVIKFSIWNKKENPTFFMELPVYHLPTLRMIIKDSSGRLKSFILGAGKVIIPVCMVISTLNNIQIDGRLTTDTNQQSVLSGVGRGITPVLSPMGISNENWPATVSLITGILAKEVVIGTLNTLYSHQQLQSLTELETKKTSTVQTVPDTYQINHFKDPERKLPVENEDANILVQSAMLIFHF